MKSTVASLLTYSLRSFPHRAMRIYIDTLNIFVRMVQILGGGGRRK
jgi:FtsH-binding integral membrane protein